MDPNEEVIHTALFASRCITVLGSSNSCSPAMYGAACFCAAVMGSDEVGGGGLPFDVSLSLSLAAEVDPLGGMVVSGIDCRRSGHFAKRRVVVRVAQDPRCELLCYGNARDPTADYAPLRQLLQAPA